MALDGQIEGADRQRKFNPAKICNEVHPEMHSLTGKVIKCTLVKDHAFSDHWNRDKKVGWYVAND